MPDTGNGLSDIAAPRIELARLVVFMRTMPVVDSILTIDETANSYKSNEKQAVTRQQVSQRETNELVVVKAFRVQR